MSTQLFLRSAASELAVAGELALLTTRGAGSTTAITNTAASGTAIPVTQTAGGTALTWWYHVGANVTIAGNIVVNLRGLESNASANACAGVLIQRINANGVNVAGTILAATNVPVTATEYGTTDAAANGTFTPTSTAIQAGEWIKVTLQVRAAGGTMAAGFTVTNTYNGASAGAAGDAYVTFTETLTPYPPGAWSAKLPGPLTSTTVDVNAPHILQSVVDDQAATSGTTQTATLTKQLTPGSLILAVWGNSVGTQNAVLTDDQGLVWTLVGAPSNQTAVARRYGLYWARNNTTAASLSVTATYGTAAISRTLSLTEVLGLDTGPTPVDGFSAPASIASSTGLTFAPIQPSTPGVFAFGVGVGGVGNLPLTPVPAVKHTIDTQAAASNVTTTFAVVRYSTVNQQAGFNESPAGPISGQTFVFRPWGTHTPKPVTAGAWTAGADGLVISPNFTGQAGQKGLFWVFVSWADTVVRTAADVTVDNVTNAGFAYGSDGSTCHALWVGWCDIPPSPPTYTVRATGASAVQALWQVIVYDSPPGGSPWGARGLQGASTFGGTAGPIPITGPVPQDLWGLNQAFVNSSTANPAVVTAGIVWNLTGSSNQKYVYQLPLLDPYAPTVTVTPQTSGLATVLSGWIDNGVPPNRGAWSAKLPILKTALVATQSNQLGANVTLPVLTGTATATQLNSTVLAAQVPLLTGALVGTIATPITLTASLPGPITGSITGTVINSGVFQSPRLPQLSTALTPGMWNNGVWGGRLASVLVGTATATQVNSGASAGQFPLLTCSLFSGNVVGAFAAQVPLLTGALTATMKVSGVTTPKLPVATAVVTGLATNSGVWGGKIASVLTSQTTLYQANPAVAAGQVASVLTATISGSVFIQAVTAGVLPLLTGQVDNLNHGALAPSLPLLTTQLTVISLNNDAVLVLELPLLMGTFSGGPFYPGALDAGLPGPVVATLTGLSTDKAVLHARLPKLRGRLTAMSVGVHVDISITPGTTRVYGIDVGNTRFRVFVTPGQTRYDALKAGSTHTGVSAGNTRIQRGPR